MTAPRFIALVGKPTHLPQARTDHLVEAARRFGLNPVLQTSGLIVLADSDAPVIAMSGQTGIAIGAVFERGGEIRGAYSKATTVKVFEQAGGDLFRSYWGGYIAFVIDTARGRVNVLRDPSGSLGCYLHRADGVDFVFSDVESAHAMGIIIGAPEPTSIIHHLTYAGLRGERTCLSGVSEVLPGTSVMLGRAEAIASQCLWTPWTFAARDHQITDRHTAAALVGLETRRCVTTWAGQFRSILHELSGGLDSSIVAACLADQAATVTCMTFVTPDAGADERAYAKPMADRIGAPLQTFLLDPADADLSGMAEAMTVRPGSGALHQVQDRMLTREVERAGVEGVFSGGGGDNVYCYLHTAAPAVDALRRHGPGPLFCRSVGDLSTLHGCTPWQAARTTLRKAMRPLRTWTRDADFLAEDAAPTSPDPHPWLQAPAGALQGRQEHILSLMAVQNPLASQASHGPAPVCYPLLSQPLIELCLRVPTWMWIAGGRNRAVARDAFGEHLPATVLRRRTKGDFTGFLGALYDKHRSEMTELLLDGWLASEALLDREAIETYLKASAPVTDYRFCRLMDLANAEVWARSWLARPRIQPVF